MSPEIIQHHEPIDFRSFYENISSGYVGIDYMDFEVFIRNEGEKHSFFATANGVDRIYDALKSIEASGKDIINKASALLITLIHSPYSEQPIKIDELQYMTDFISKLNKNCNISWGIAVDQSLGNEVKIILLANIKIQYYGV